MKRTINAKKGTRPNLKSKGFSRRHIELFEQILYSGKTNCDINLAYGYTRKSHCVVDHTRKVMQKLLALEHLRKEAFKEQVVYPRTFDVFWKKLLIKHKSALLQQAIIPRFYTDSFQNEATKIKLNGDMINICNPEASNDQ